MLFLNVVFKLFLVLYKFNINTFMFLLMLNYESINGLTLVRTSHSVSLIGLNWGLDIMRA